MDKRLAQKVLGNCTEALLNLPTVEEVLLWQQDVTSRSSAVILCRTSTSANVSSNVQSLVYAAAAVFGATSNNCDIVVQQTDGSRVRHEWVGFGGHRGNIIR